MITFGSVLHTSETCARQCDGQFYYSPDDRSNLVASRTQLTRLDPPTMRHVSFYRTTLCKRGITILSCIHLSVPTRHCRCIVFKTAKTCNLLTNSLTVASGDVIEPTDSRPMPQTTRPSPRPKFGGQGQRKMQYLISESRYKLHKFITLSTDVNNNFTRTILKF